MESPRAVYSTSSLNLLRTFQLEQREQRGEEEKNVRWRDHAAEVCYSSYPGKYTVQSFCAEPSVWQREWETLCESRALVSLHHSMSLVSAYCVLVFIPSLLLVSPVQLFTPVFPLSALPLAPVSLSIGCLLPQVFPPLLHVCPTSALLRGEKVQVMQRCVRFGFFPLAFSRICVCATISHSDSCPRSSFFLCHVIPHSHDLNLRLHLSSITPSHSDHAPICVCVCLLLFVCNH